MTDSENPSNTSTKEPPRIKKNRRRMSLATIFRGSFFSILILFILVNIMVIYLFIDFQSILSKLSTDVLPKVTLSGQTFNKVNELSYLTARLASSPTQAFRRIAYQDIENKIEKITYLDLDNNNDPYLKEQLNAITREFSGLNLLIEKRIQLQKKVKKYEKEMYGIHGEVLSFSLNKELNSNSSKSISWLLGFTEVVTLSSKALAMSRLNQVRQIATQLESRFKTLIEKSAHVRLSNKTNAVNLTTRLKTILISENGLLPTRIQELRSIGQATGRNNFVHNLVGDYTMQVQFHSHELNEVIIAETKSTASRVKSQTQIIKLVAIGSILFLMGAAYFLQRKIIRRLLNLNYNVIDRLDGGDLNLNISGNDEISDIAQSFNYLVDKIEKQKQKLQELSLTDGLTGVANRRHLDTRLMSELKSSQRHKLPVSILMMDVDSFKSFNDHYGHIAGDDCLKEITHALKKCMHRESDFIARFGGEEFVLILPDTTSKGAELIAKTILSEISSLKITHEWSTATPYVTLSIGIATFGRQQDPINGESFLKRADDALFQAKEKGKNCFVTFRSS